MNKTEFPTFIKRRENNNIINKIPKIIIQTYKNNLLDNFIIQNINKMLDKNKDYDYMLITDEMGIQLIKDNFDDKVLNAFNRLNIGAAKADFIRYVALYIYGGVYLDLDASIEIELNTYIKKIDRFIFFMDANKNLNQWIFMIDPKNIFLKIIIEEMVRRIDNSVDNIFLATGPTLFTDVIYNYMNNDNIFNTRSFTKKEDREVTFIKNNNFSMGRIIDEMKESKNKFKERMDNYNVNMIYNNDRYIPTWNSPTPNLYKY